ncbi:MAG: type VI secretion system baseplate subunit TssG [Syntrophobacteraceae bacterium]
MVSLKERISREIYRFDIISLLFVLHTMGYPRDQIFFRSHYNLSSQPSLLEKIEFHDTPLPQVIIYVNLGLMSVQTPLPSYFFEKLDQGFLDTEAFADFLAFFDRRLLGKYILSIYPEVNPEVFPDWEMAKRQYAGMLNLRSCSTLHWLFNLVFPELGVQVEKAMLSRGLETNDIVLGRSFLDGSSVFGKRTSVPVQGQRVVLTSDDEVTGTGAPWPREIRERMESMIFPLLKSVGIDLEVFLIIRSQKSWARLHAESFLGYDRIKGGKVQQRRIPIYLGYLVE